MFTLVRFFCCYKNVFVTDFDNNNNSLSVRDAEWRAAGSWRIVAATVTSNHFRCRHAPRHHTEPTTSCV